MRTPFVKAFTDFTRLDTIALGVAAVRALCARHDLPYREIEGVVWGGVILPSGAPNVGREIALDLKLDPGSRGDDGHPRVCVGTAGGDARGGGDRAR